MGWPLATAITLGSLIVLFNIVEVCLYYHEYETSFFECIYPPKYVWHILILPLYLPSIILIALFFFMRAVFINCYLPIFRSTLGAKLPWRK